MTRHLPTILGLGALLALGGASVAQGQSESCESRLALADVKLASEIERADAQAYLTRLELTIAKRELAAALAKCGPACAPAR